MPEVYSHLYAHFAVFSAEICFLELFWEAVDYAFVYTRLWAAYHLKSYLSLHWQAEELGQSCSDYCYSRAEGLMFIHQVQS